MSQNGCFVLTTNWLDDDNNNSNNDGKDPVRAQLKQLEKQNRELQEALKTAQATARGAAIKDVLTEKGKPAKLARLIPADIDATPEAIEKWLEEYADLFTATTDTTKTDSTNTNEGAQGGQQQVTDEQAVAAMNAALRVAQATNGAQVPQSKPDELFKQLMDPTLTQDALVKLIEQHGGGTGVG